MSAPKKRRTYSYNPDWEEDYCFVEIKEKCVCLLCNFPVATAKKSNVERHFQTNHGTFDFEYRPKSQLRIEKIRELKSVLTKQQSMFTRPSQKSKNATTASFKIAHFLAKKKKPFIDGELFKEAFLAGSDSLFEGFSNK